MVPPLLGDVRGIYRVHIVGNCGTGKSTVGSQLADILGVPYICLDTLFWKPGWAQETNEQFRINVEEALAAAPNGWVVDGNYGRRIGMIVEDSATDVICKFNKPIYPNSQSYTPRRARSAALTLLSSHCPQDLPPTARARAAL
ncbi:hypothetical protein DFH06DRAFT_1195282 [Mycena polygramma]|nr:hypothetical protein DFH06DRAFT_1195282 [Mycena polygramma]